ncbi:MAG: polysaccharide deacetylase family protein [Clostridia bacterium]|nr:polysaccharide deacetylase family protein [Clostridia bacterium]
MSKFAKIIPALVISASILLSGCGSKVEPEKNNSAQNTIQSTKPTDNQGSSTPVPQGNDTNARTATPKPSIDLSKVKPNETGKIMVVMFHNFVESFTPTKYDNGEYTTTFDEFRKLLQTLYDKNYRLVNVNDYLNNNISVPAGCIPMMFTFDDGTSGQFNLVEEGGKLVANKQSAVGIMEEFNKTHPDFGLKGTFYVNLGLGTFEGKGTVNERLKYLIDQGFEIGNHTLTHINLREVKTAEKVLQEVGGNHKKMLELVPDYKLGSLALPFGNATKDLQGYVAKGEFEGVSYENRAIMEVGWDPTYSPVSKKFNPLSTHRVRASGIKPVDTDLAWWLKNLSVGEQYVSDGDPNTVTVPKSREEAVDKNKLNGKQLVVY